MSVLDSSKSYCRFFEEFSAIPHGSYNEKAISEYLIQFAKDHQLKYLTDELYNVVMYKPATAGCENQPTLMLQAHTDMVCEKNPSVSFDFTTQPLQLYVEDNKLKAKGTTLGADDGNGIAYILAILDDNQISHPNIEAVFTSAEEVGLVGAKALKKDYFKATRMINLDGGGETITCVSSAGGLQANSSTPVHWQEVDKPTYQLLITGLDGGHSGGCIANNKGNANKLLARALNIIGDLQLVSFNGGTMVNAITNEAKAEFVTELENVEEIVSKINQTYKNEYSESDKNVEVILTKLNKAENAMDANSTNNVLNFLYLIPDGLQLMSQSIKGLPLLSLNMGIVKTLENEVKLYTCIRSPLDSAKFNLLNQIKSLAKLCNTTISLDYEFPGWNYDPNSQLREILRSVCLEKGYEGITEVATHGGLETGIFKGLISNLDIITLGPIADGEHTPEEYLDLASFDRSYEILKSIVEKCSKE